MCFLLDLIEVFVTDHCCTLEAHCVRWKVTVLLVLSDRSIDRTQQLIAVRWKVTVVLVLSDRSIDRAQQVNSSRQMCFLLDLREIFVQLIAVRWKVTVVLVLSDRSIDRAQQLIAVRWKVTAVLVLSDRSIDRAQQVNSSRQMRFLFDHRGPRWRLTVLVVLSDRSIDRNQQVNSSRQMRFLFDHRGPRWRLTVLVVLSDRSIDRNQQVGWSLQTCFLPVFRESSVTAHRCMLKVDSDLTWCVLPDLTDVIANISSSRSFMCENEGNSSPATEPDPMSIVTASNPEPRDLKAVPYDSYSEAAQSYEYLPRSPCDSRGSLLQRNGKTPVSVFNTTVSALYGQKVIFSSHKQRRDPLSKHNPQNDQARKHCTPQELSFARKVKLLKLWRPRRTAKQFRFPSRLELPPKNHTKTDKQKLLISPLLFMIYFNDVGPSVQNRQLVQYADDTTLFQSKGNDVHGYETRGREAMEYNNVEYGYMIKFHHKLLSDLSMTRTKYPTTLHKLCDKVIRLSLAKFQSLKARLN
ncbi:hypothetical protein J6590_067411 [Homalodisca vitripennis]|nr:hypothetical protein J6590_067411 [Homalodisca vitripennis]